MIGIIFRYLFLMLIASALYTGYFLTETPAGLELSLKLLSLGLPGKLEIEQTQGKLFSAFSLHRVTYQDNDVIVKIEDLSINWNPAQLLNERIDINKLALQQLQVNIIPTEQSHWNVHILSYLAQHILIHQLQLDKASVTSTQATIYFSGNINPSWNIGWEIDIPQLERISKTSSGQFYSHGTITGNLHTPKIQGDFDGKKLIFGEQKFGRIQGKINLNPQPNSTSSIQLMGSNIQIHDYPVKHLDVALTLRALPDKKNYSTAIAIAINRYHNMDLSFSMPRTAQWNNYLHQDFKAQLKFHLNSLKEIADFLPHTQDVRGKILGTLDFKGTLAEPIATGNINLTNASMRLTKLGIHLNQINLLISGNESKQLSYQGSMRAETGIVNIAGTTQLAKTDFPTHLTVTGDNFQILNLPEYKLFISPQLKIELSTKNINAQGTIYIPEAKITPKDFRRTITLSDDVVYVGQKTTSATSLLALAPSMQITLNLGNKVFIHYQDFEAMLRGNLLLLKHPNGLVTASGQLYAIDGTYNAYGQVLKIQEGRFIYTGGMLTNPGLNIRATRQFKTALSESMNSFSQSSQNIYAGNQLLTVGIQIVGSLDFPAITLFSDPSTLSQSNILSYLILGVPEPTSGNDKDMLLSAASALNLANSGNGASQFASMTKKIQDSLGLTEFNVESVQTFDPNANLNNGGMVGNTSLVLGKQIADKLYVHSSVSLFASPPVYIFNVQYTLSKHWSIQTETSTIESGADLLYSIERN